MEEHKEKDSMVDKWYKEGQRSHRPVHKFFKKVEKKIRVGEAKQKAINKLKK